MVIDWVNSLDIPSCTLADDLQDLKSGCVVADIVSWLYDIDLPDIQRNISSRNDAITNWCIILEVLMEIVPKKFLALPEDFLDDNEKLLRLLEFFTTIKKEPQIDNKNIINKPKLIENITQPKEIIPVPQALPKAILEGPNKMPEQIRYEPRPVPESFKETLVEWLEDLHIVRKDPNILSLIPNICRTGVMLCDLVNRLEGRSEIIKGIERNPKNKTQALANINKVLEYLRAFPKMNSRYLWSSKEIIEGDEYVIWGILDDIKLLFTIAPKIKQPPIPSPISTPTPLSAPIPIKTPTIPNTNLSLPIASSQDKIKIPKPLIKETSKSLRSYSNSMKKFNKSSSINTPRISRPPSSRSNKSEIPKSHNFTITVEMKKTVLVWIKALGIEYEANSNICHDIVRNGLLVCEIMRLVEGENIKINPNPKSSQAIYENFYNAIVLFRAKHPEAPITTINNPECMAENSEIVFAFLYALMSTYPQAAPPEYLPCSLPYGAVGIRRLENVVVNWVDNLNLLQPSPQYFGELVPELKKGVLLCVLTSKLTMIKIFNIIPDPKTEQSAINNIRKALEILRKLPKMSQKFTWSEKEIYKGNYCVLLGLMEDLMRWADGLPTRKNGNDYHKDGPYLRPNPPSEGTMPKLPEENFNMTFGSSSSPKQSEKNDPIIEENEEIDEYSQWLYAIGADFPRSLSFKDEHIPEFTTGVLICNIVSQLEKIKIPGVDKEPRTRASAIQNINKALVVLKKKQGFSKELHSIAEEIFLGNGTVIRSLMQELMGLYKSKPFTRFSRK
ncbi:hypothetical protein SteCoe_8816 [Stentor coeruleus]|uniref:Calponin-homology (CH) domain-containing protein n=1 Tax=Stentor coeruleus TaxID=5963 RepID=A0A1R2CJ82_9CILI|nr:hypothetical protein SteCoe_8816 [Stentor coeruleus]